MAFLQTFALFLVLSVLLNTQCRAQIWNEDDYTFKSSTASASSTTNTSSVASSGITTLPIVIWKWHHVETPYLVALWVLTCWLCKLGKQHHIIIFRTISISTIVYTKEKKWQYSSILWDVQMLKWSLGLNWLRLFVWAKNTY